MSEAIRLGVLGTGLAFEQIHWPVLSAMRDGFDIRAFVEPRDESATRMRNLTGLSADAREADATSLLAREDIDAVLIALPIPLQAAAIEQSLRAGKHVFAEKPPAGDMTSARHLLDVAREHPDQVLLVGEHYLYRRDVRLAADLIASGRIGRPHLLAFRKIWRLVADGGGFSGTPWRQEGAFLGGPHLDAGVHDIARIIAMMGSVERVAGDVQDANPAFGGPFDLSITMRYASGAIGNYVAAYLPVRFADEPNDCRVYGTEGTLIFADTSVSVIDSHGEESWDFTDDAIGGGYREEWENFANAILHGEPVVGTLDASVRCMEVIDAALRSAETGATAQLGQ